MLISASDFYCPLTVERHSQAEEVEIRAIRWLEDRGFFDDMPADDRAALTGTRIAELCGMATPHASEEKLLNCTKWLYCMWHVDDKYSDASHTSQGALVHFVRMASNLLRAISVPKLATNDPLLIVANEISKDMRRYASDVQMRRWQDAQRRWLMGVAWEISNVVDGALLGVDEYLAMRLNSSGVLPSIATFDIAQGGGACAEEMDSSTVQALTEMTALIVALDNDIYSHPMEKGCARNSLNVIELIRGPEDEYDGELVTRVREIRDPMMWRFLELREQVGKQCSPELSEYLSCLENTIGGCIDIGLKAPRYAKWLDGNPQISLAAPNVPLRTDSLDYPSVEWWWPEK
ncbi:terpene synthase family protein [Streptomyces sp. NBC_01233]|uniref:terpene synthase family protein n=1 Tax=Streptomyces sp. NBC_01233 TaxID=2903787 RepID=UPI002E0F25A7|nr:terpene synthase family protein [Streptomyces sp. NBC_01233]